MLKRRQFIFGKQNINRHQPQVDDVVTSVYTQYNNASNISDEGDVDAVMKFAPTKKEVIDIIKSSIPAQIGAVFNISEEDVEFVDTFLYKDSDYDHIGYVYKLTKGSATAGGLSLDLSDVHIMCAGPVLASDGKTASVTTREPTKEDQRYIRHVFYSDHFILDPALPDTVAGGNRKIVTDVDTIITSIPITELLDPSYVVNITTDVLPHIIDHIYLELVYSTGDGSGDK